MSSNKLEERNKFTSTAVIKVIGVGGGGGNALNTMIESGLTGVEFIAANTDVQALQANLAPIKIQLGKELTKGLGAGANPDAGRNAALEDKILLQEVLSGADMVFVTGGMGGGTGTGAAPIIAQVAREMGALTVGVVTKPFIFEGKRRKQQSELGIQALKQSVDTLITIPNQRLLSIAPSDMSMLDGFKLADEVLLNAVKGISDIINIPGRVNVDFADVKTIMSEMGMALMGIGSGKGEKRAQEAARSAISSPLLEDIDIEGATGILINITGTSTMTLHEISEASSLIQEAAHEDANIIFGAVIDETMGDSIRVTVIATGFDQARVSYPDQTQNFANASSAPQFITNNSPVVPAQQFSSLNSARTPQNSYAQKSPVQGSQYDSRMAGNQNSYHNSNQHSPFTRPSQPFAPQNTHYSQTGLNAQPPLSRSQDNSGQSAFRNLNAAASASRDTQAARPQSHQPQTAQSYGAAANSSLLTALEEPLVETLENRMGASVINTAPDSLDDNTQTALKLAQELADLELDDTDYETPAFMRKKEDSARGM